VPAYSARILRRVVGNRFADVWGPIESIDTNTQQQFAKFRVLATAEALDKADASAGRAVFSKTCAACHKLHGHGGNVGPDITGANRSNMEYLLGNILTPSAIIQDTYKMHIVLTDDGRIYSGIPAEENERQLKLRVADRKEPITIAKSQIESREIAPVSMMPKGTLETLSDAEAVNLLKYLQMTAQVPLP
jgi:putative heme-binding domain-containing protein